MGTDTVNHKPCKKHDAVRFYTKSVDGDVWACLKCRLVLPLGRKLKSITESDMDVLIEFAIAVRDHHAEKKKAKT